MIGDFRPDMVFAPDPCVKTEGHTDHLNVGEAVRRLAVFSSHEGIMEKLGASRARVQAVAFYMTAKVNRYVGRSGYLKKSSLKRSLPVMSVSFLKEMLTERKSPCT